MYFLNVFSNNMKKRNHILKKIMALVLVLSALFSTVAFAAEAKDNYTPVSESVYNGYTY